MAKSDREPGGRRTLRVLVGILVVALLAGGGVAWRTGWAEEWWHDLRADAAGPPADPAAVAPPPEVDVAPVAVPGVLAPAADGTAALKRAELRKALAPLGDRDLGKHVIAAVGPLDGTGLSYRIAEGPAVAIPASTTKIVTSAAALFLLGPDRVFSTTTVLDRSAGTTPRLVLVGGGDPFLARAPEPPTAAATYQPVRADVRTLAQRTARALKADGVRQVALGYDDSLFSGPALHPTWRPDYVPEEINPVSALWVDEGRPLPGQGPVADPSAEAARVFRDALAARGITVTGATTRTRAPAAATPVGAVTSPTVAQIVQRLIEVSDNAAAEILLRQAGVADQGEGSFAAGQRAVTRVLSANGIAMRGSVLHDGSGLSRDNRLSPVVLVDVLRLAASADHPQLRALLAALPVAGYTGSLANRMDLGPDAGRGRVRAKTGTLTGVTSLAGIAVDRDGHLMAFALMADRVKKPKSMLARVAMDNAAAALGACAC
ncbi:D-alanyl-D-alanine carboxypeptidase/D-alanyl-D-alanine-endopeptidase [Pimelobacter simplex]|uniref:D-alanyl-D-alanine carboxypeptidase n=1 Tax=Nocardioides simplex TaxID=2045 RepID=A0A0C5XFY1_NOCSI|nr:D-alanyl-D-alanine carboxypeptidase/D-alanyl-D-alanine-endopeptidase [Pimelobacter simplex]AJR18081.1 D-alanyl-D-alanine carboxypeptidase [Pimelobacter simplex]MCG8151020.1 D-alanyl-D-alanine carboxypeptidase/D-alanyl-D-alanine-endopeptidase [Pimelobacter simplex]GEB12347.1 D-alanyl-D-alanine carboxypeptidase [Pimelobacter simplex]SFM96206.1 D-alanyl-D-alanine carboxypeptidase / D-alanyl-D-alanine-endopeptidase (penicillin-binding protein 4) [Pimelobacter simplex]